MSSSNSYVEVLVTVCNWAVEYRDEEHGLSEWFGRGAGSSNHARTSESVEKVEASADPRYVSHGYRCDDDTYCCLLYLSVYL